ncbi:MAG TPA: c-type cytochrome [Longimicrobium sp.]|jgi:cytochrome c2|nr:c-type cytochrome [Longimicrobium sp.]
MSPRTLRRGWMLGPLLALAAAACTQAGVSAEEAMSLTRGGRAERGKVWMQEYGCGGCHEIPGIPGARGRVGPALGGVGTRLFIAGVSPNQPSNLIAWIQDPPAMDSSTAMPNVGLNRAQARDVAAYLYTLAR